MIESSYGKSYSDQHQQEVLNNLFKFIRSEMGQRGVKDKTNTVYKCFKVFIFIYFYAYYMFCINEKSQ